MPKPLGKDQMPSWQWILIPILLFNLLFLNFVRSNNYFLLSLDVLVLSAIASTIGALYGATMAFFQKSRVVLLGGLVFFFVDFQTNLFNAPESTIWHIILLSYAAASLACWLVLKYFNFTIFPVLTFMFVVTLAKSYPAKLPLALQSKLPTLKASNQSKSTSKSKSKLPLWIHIILDAHLGPAGFPAKYDPGQKLAKSVSSDYLKHGFALYGKSFTRANFTNRSLRHMFTFSEEGIHDKSYNIRESKNEYFRILKQRGYKLNIFQTDVVYLCNPGKRKNKYVDHCLTYHHQDLRVIRNLSVSARMSYLYGAFEQRSRILIRIHSLWNVFRQKVWRNKFNWGDSTIPIVGLDVLNWMKRELPRAKPGQAIVVHALLPHSPFVLDKNCKRLPRADVQQHPRAVYRSQMYHRYNQQVRCVQRKMNQIIAKLKEAKLFDDAVVLVHSDHGSRIAEDDMANQPPPTKNIQKKSFFDHYSTLFAAKLPRSPKGKYFSFRVPIVDLFDSFVKRGKLPQQPPSGLKSHIFLTPRYSKTRKVKLPQFLNSKVLP